MSCTLQNAKLTCKADYNYEGKKDQRSAVLSSMNCAHPPSPSPIGQITNNRFSMINNKWHRTVLQLRGAIEDRISKIGYWLFGEEGPVLRSALAKEDGLRV